MRVLKIQRMELWFWPLVVLAMVSGCRQTEVFTKEKPIDLTTVTETPVPPSTGAPVTTTTVRPPVVRTTVRPAVGGSNR